MFSGSCLLFCTSYLITYVIIVFFFQTILLSFPYDGIYLCCQEVILFQLEPEQAQLHATQTPDIWIFQFLLVTWVYQSIQVVPLLIFWINVEYCYTLSNNQYFLSTQLFAKLRVGTFMYYVNIDKWLVKYFLLTQLFFVDSTIWNMFNYVPCKHWHYLLLLLNIATIFYY